MMTGIKINGDKAENLKKKKKCSTLSFIKLNIKEMRCVGVIILLTLWPCVDCVLQRSHIAVQKYPHSSLSLGGTLLYACKLVYVPSYRIDLNVLIIS